jgi:hypothetical protein
LTRLCASDPENVGQRDFDAFVARNIYARYSRHDLSPA